MKLSELLLRALGLDWSGPDPSVTSVVQDHRRATPGALFIARAGARFDGRRLVGAAAALGAVAVVAEASELLADSVLPLVTVPDAEAVTGLLASTLLGDPSGQLRVIGVTGTDGKTSTSFLLRHLLSRTETTALISTAEVHDGRKDMQQEGHFTTPEAPEVQAYLAAAVRAGSRNVVLESSSHALDRHRLAGVAYSLAIWTNLTEEHLDWHGSMENYLLAKRGLVSRAGTAVLNLDDPHFARFSEAAGRVISYGTDARADWRASDIHQERTGLHFTVHAAGSAYPAFLPMLGEFNVHNALAALAAAAHLGADTRQAVEQLATFSGVPGRMELISTDSFTVTVDFAHTGPALVKALSALRRVTAGRIILVIGAAGERDHGKRGPLARAAVAGADLIFFTEEDSRSEDTMGILQQLNSAAQAAQAGPEQVRLEPDRKQAIRLALQAAGPGDLVLLAGKGVERTLERSDETIPWDEKALALELLSETGPGPLYNRRT